MPSRRRRHRDCASSSSWNDQAPGVMTCCTSTSRWFGQYWSTPGIATALPQAAETIRRRAWWPAVLLRHDDSDSTGVRLSCVALQSHRCTDKGTGVAAAQSDAGHFPGQRLHDVTHQSWTRNAGVTLRPADWTIFPVHYPAGDVIPPLSAPGQARSLCHRQAATSKKL